MANVTLKINKSGPSSIPSILSFPQGVPGDVDDVIVTIGQKGNGKTMKTILLAEGNNISYKGCDFGEGYSTKLDSCKFAIGILNKDTNEMSLQVVDHAFVMKPQLRETKVAPRMSSLSNLDRKNSLTEEFGSRKKKRALQAAQSNIISSENISGAAAVETAMASQFESMENNSLIDAAEEALEQNRMELLPKYNMSALVLDEAFPVEGLIPADLQTSLDEHCVEILAAHKGGHDVMNFAKKYFSSQGYASALILSLVEQTTQTVAAISKNSKALKAAKTAFQRLLVLYCMLKFHGVVTQHFDFTVSKEQLYTALAAPDFLVRHISNSFATYRVSKGKPSFTASKTQIQKLLLRAIILGLVVNKYSINLTIMCQDLKLTAAILTDLAKETGCRVTKGSIELAGEEDDEGDRAVSRRGSGPLTAELTLPLKFPVQRKPKGKKN